MSSRLEEEIAILERRVEQIGPDGDCAYEAAMIRFFEQQIIMRRTQLATDAGPESVSASEAAVKGWENTDPDD